MTTERVLLERSPKAGRAAARAIRVYALEARLSMALLLLFERLGVISRCGTTWQRIQQSLGGALPPRRVPYSSGRRTIAVTH